MCSQALKPQKIVGVESQGERNVTVSSHILLIIAKKWLVCVCMCVYFDTGYVCTGSVL